MLSAIDIFRQIEETCKTQNERDMGKLLGREADMTNEELHNFRGRVMAVNDLRRTLRANLGYDPDNL